MLEKILEDYSKENNIEKEELDFYFSGCCVKSTFQSMTLPEGTTYSDLITERVNKYKKYYNGYKNLTVDIKNIKFDILKYYPEVAFEDTTEEVEDNLNYIDLIDFLEKVVTDQIENPNDSEYMYGLDNSIYSIDAKIKNQWNNYFWIQKSDKGCTLSMDLEEALKIYNLLKFFPVTNNQELVIGFAKSEKISLEEEINTFYEKIARNKERIEDLNETTLKGVE